MNVSIFSITWRNNESFERKGNNFFDRAEYEKLFLIF